MALNAWQEGLKYDPVHEEMNVNLVRAEYALRKSKPNSVIKTQITDR